MNLPIVLLSYIFCIFYYFNIIKKKEKIIIIGSGIGGLSLAAMLSESKKVIVLEKHSEIGGCMHTFLHKGIRLNTGLHYVGDISELKELIPDVNFKHLEKYDKYISESGKSFTFTTYEKTLNKLIKRFPEYKSGIERFFNKMKKTYINEKYYFISKLLPLILRNLYLKYFSNQDTLLKDFFEKENFSQELVDILFYCSGDHGIKYEECTFREHSTVMYHYLNKGAYKPIGGSQSIVDLLINKIEKNGGLILKNANVVKISKNKKITYKFNNKEYELFPDRIVSNAGLYNTFKMSPSIFSEEIKYLENLPDLTSHVILFIPIKANIVNIPNHWIQEKDRKIFISFFEDHIQMLYEEKYETFEQYKTKRKSFNYLTIKKNIKKYLLNILYKHFPLLEISINENECIVGTPITIEKFLNKKRGMSYSLRNTKDRKLYNMTLPKTKLKGLYLTGSDIVGPGIMGAFSGAILTYYSMLF